MQPYAIRVTAPGTDDPTWGEVCRVASTIGARAAGGFVMGSDPETRTVTATITADPEQAEQLTQDLAGLRMLYGCTATLTSGDA